MNYLAHLFLAGTDPEMILGNFIADHVKGSDILKYSPNIRNGIAMHRSIDTYTDQHPVVKSSIARLRTDFRKYAGVIVDMYYDHYLSAHWNEFSAIDIHTFTKTRYDILNTFEPILPLRSARLLYFMEKQNWLLSYASFEGMQQAFNGMSRRTTFESNMELAVINLKAGYTEFRHEFNQFFPDLQQFVNDNFDLKPTFLS
ncbi:MAG: ACP phosphodiesterase [Bacteroidota bacterium]